MSQDLLNEYGVLDKSNNLDRPFVLLALGNIDIENTLEPVRSSHSTFIAFFKSLPRSAGVMAAWYLLLGVNTPWNRVRFTLGSGTSWP